MQGGSLGDGVKSNCGNIILKATFESRADRTSRAGVRQMRGEQSSLTPSEKRLMPLTETKRPPGKQA